MFNTQTKIVVMFNLLVITLALFLNPRFQTNDDVGMIYAFSGTGMFDSPTPVTAFGTKIFGILMVFLYQLLPTNFEVYTIVLILLLFLSNILVYSKLLQYISYKDSYFLLFFIPVLIFITLYFYLELQFTMVAGWLGFAGMLTILNKPKKNEIIIGLIFILLSTLLRPSIVPIILGFVLLLNIAFVLISKKSLAILKPFLINFTLFFIVFLSVYFIDIQIHTKEEKQFLAFNTFRSGIVDFNINETKSNSNPFLWEKEELDLFKNWFYNDSILYSKEIDYNKATNNQHNQFIEKLNFDNIKLAMLLSQFGGPTYRCIFILAFIPILLFKRGKRNFIFFIFFILTYICYYSVLSILFKEPPFRVSFMMFSAGIIFYLIEVSKNKLNERFSTKNWKAFVCSILILYALWITKISMDMRKNDFAINFCKEKYDHKILYIRWKDYPYDYANPFMISSSMRNIKFVSMGAFSIHPSVNNSFGKIIFNNLTNDIIGKDSIVSFLLPKDKLIWKSLEISYINFIKKHYHKTVYFDEVQNSNHCYDYAEFKIKLKRDEAKLD
ncbi:MAG: hypothetical protein PSX81_13430 [bacterium]|nr:hypothetical protein [bacterium]